MRSPTALTALAAAALTANPALAQDFVYQGSLSDNNQPADGLYDLTFEYYTTISGGPALQTATRDDVLVTEGVFQVTLPMPPSDDARFLELAVRDGASTGGYTQLLPRTFIASTPYATKALNVEWDRNMSDFLTFGDGNDVVLINRENRLGSEYFGIGADTNGFAGMYVDTTGANGLPFYGYSTNSFAGSFAYHYLEGSSGDLRFVVGNVNRYTMGSDGTFTSQGDINADTVEADAFEYAAAQSRLHAIPPAAFRPSDMSSGFIPHVSGGSEGAAYISSGGSLASMVAPLYLPDGSEVIRIRVSFFDGDTTRLLQAQLRRTSRSGVSSFIDVVGTGTSQTVNGVLSKLVTSPDRFIDLDSYSYEVLLAVGGNGWSPVDGNLSVRWVMIDYQVTQPE